MNTPRELSIDTTLAGKSVTLATTWGLFSPKSIDEGTELLLQYLDIKPTDNCLDLGCGYGPLGLAMAIMAPNGQTHMVDKDFMAVDYAQRNAETNHISNARAYLSNGLEQVPADAKFDVIATNLPAKINGELIDIFLADAYDRLNPGGRFYVVTISGLKDYMKRRLTEQFDNYDKLKQSKTYTAAVAIR